jgi:hypothetical protein
MYFLNFFLNNEKVFPNYEELFEYIIRNIIMKFCEENLETNGLILSFTFQ